MSITAMYRVAIVLAVIGAASSITTTRRVTVRVENHCTSHRLITPRIHMHHGRQIGQMADAIPPGGSGTVKYEKKTGAAHGAAAVFTYDLAPINTGSPAKRVAFMCSIPWWYELYNAWYGAGIFETYQECDGQLYSQMHANDQNVNFQRRAIDDVIDYKRGIFTVKQRRTHDRRNSSPAFVLEISDTE